MARLRFGLFITGLPREHGGPQEYTRRTVELTQVARDAGFHSVVAGQHLVSGPFQYLQPVPLLSRLVPESGDMDLVTGILLLPLFNPVDVAEQLATLDVLSDGRAVLGIGAGYRQEEFDAFGVDRQRRLARIRESLEVIRALWAGGPVSYHGEEFQLDVPPASMVPVRPGGPPVWVAAMAERSVRRVVAEGNSPFVGPRIDLATLRRWSQEEQLFAGSASLPIRRELFVSTTSSEEAWQQAEHHIGARYETYRQWGQEQDLDARSDAASMRDYLRDRAIVGTPHDCIEQLLAYEAAGITEVVLRVAWPTLPWDGIIDQVALLGRHVVPAFRPA